MLCISAPITAFILCMGALIHSRTLVLPSMGGKVAVYWVHPSIGGKDAVY